MRTIAVPDIGDFKEVEVIEVLIRPGGEVAAEESLLVLESDKATMDVPSPCGGKIIAVYIKAGDKVSRGDKIADIAENNVAAETSVTAESPPVAPSPGNPPLAETAQERGEIREVTVPDIGDFKEVEVIEVLIRPGGEVAAEESLLVLESDKATMDVPSPFAGTVREVLVATGDKVGAGDLIAKMQTGSSAASSPAVATSTPSAPVAALIVDGAPIQESSAAAHPAPPLPPVVEQKGQFAKVHAGPAVRRFARELGADLAQVPGSGRKGRVLKEDVQKFVKSKMSAPAAEKASLPEVPAVDFSQFGEIEKHPRARIRKLSAANLHRNWLVAPHVTQFLHADVTDLESFRRGLADESKEYKITLLAFLIKAAVMALRKMPRFNSSLAGDELVLKKYFNIGVAVDTPGGLMVPVLRGVDKKGLDDIAREVGDISRRARDNKLKGEDLQGGCFTISSLGGIGGSFFTPILNLPEVAILGVSRAQTLPHWDGKEFQPRLLLPLALSYDHRVIDGVEGARFITYFGELLGDIRRLAL